MDGYWKLRNMKAHQCHVEECEHDTKYNQERPNSPTKLLNDNKNTQKL